MTYYKTTALISWFFRKQNVMNHFPTTNLLYQINDSLDVTEMGMEETWQLISGIPYPDIPYRRLSQLEPISLETIAVELKLKTENWILISCYRPPNIHDSVFTENITSILDKYSFLTDRPKKFYKSTSVETGISDFHHIIITVMKGSNQKPSQKYLPAVTKI